MVTSQYPKDLACDTVTPTQHPVAAEIHVFIENLRQAHNGSEKGIDSIVVFYGFRTFHYRGWFTITQVVFEFPGESLDIWLIKKLKEGIGVCTLHLV